MAMLRKVTLGVGLSAMGLALAGCIHVRTTTRDLSKTVHVRAPFARVDVEVPDKDDDRGTDAHLDVNVDH